VNRIETMEKLTAASPDTKSADLIAENIGRLKALFPEAFSEGKVDFQALAVCENPAHFVAACKLDDVIEHI